MKTRAIILAGGEGTRLGVLTAKRTKPAVPFAGKYRIIDFPLSNCVNSHLFDVMIIAQYRPQSLIEHIGAGGPWDLDRDFTGGLRIYTPYKSRAAGWFIGTADAVQQNFSFIKTGQPDLVLILSGDHIYTMDYARMIQAHLDSKADLTMATIEVPMEEAHRFGIVGVDENNNVISFVEKPAEPASNLINMGVYLFNCNVLNEALWLDHMKQDSTHDFGKDILPALINSNAKVCAYPYTGYWVDVGTVNSYWQAHMDLIATPPAFDLFKRDWIIHTRTEEQPPAFLHRKAYVEESLISNGCIIEDGARVIRSILSPGVRVRAGAVIEESIVLTDSSVHSGSSVLRSVIDKRVTIEENVAVGSILEDRISIAMVGKNAVVPKNMHIEPGGMVGTDVAASDYLTTVVQTGAYIQTRRLPYEL
jgi:glucose-1-phosphate adenylyltransferase